MVVNTKVDAGDLEKVFGKALSVPINLIAGLADLLIAKGVLSKAEVIDLIHDISSHAHGEHEAMVEGMLETFATRFESDQGKEH